MHTFLLSTPNNKNLTTQRHVTYAHTPLPSPMLQRVCPPTEPVAATPRAAGKNRSQHWRGGGGMLEWHMYGHTNVLQAQLKLL